jgi:hypothetical protein
MGLTACTELQCLYKDALYLYLFKDIAECGRGMFADTVLGFVRRHAEEIYIQNRELYVYDCLCKYTSTSLVCFMT